MEKHIHILMIYKSGTGAVTCSFWSYFVNRREKKDILQSSCCCLVIVLTPIPLVDIKNLNNYYNIYIYKLYIYIYIYIHIYYILRFADVILIDSLTTIYYIYIYI